MRILLIGVLMVFCCTLVGAIFHFERLLAICGLLVVGTLFVVFRFSDGILRLLHNLAASGILSRSEEQSQWITRALDHAKDWIDHLRSIVFTFLWNLSLWIADLYATLLSLPETDFSATLLAKAMFSLSCLSLAAYAQSRDLKRNKQGLLSWILNYVGALSFYFTILRLSSVAFLSVPEQVKLTHWLAFPLVFVVTRVLRVDHSVQSWNLISAVLADIGQYAVPILLVGLVVVTAVIATIWQRFFGSRETVDPHCEVEERQRRSVAAELSLVGWFVSPVLIWISLVVGGILGSL